MSIRVLVTGGAGFIGSHVVDRLVDCGNNILVVDNLSTGKPENIHDMAQLEQLDIRDRRIINLAKSFKPHILVHCAAQPSVTNSTSEPLDDAAINITGGLNVAIAAIEAGCAQLTYVTTGGALYGNPDYSPCDEDHPIRPISPYGLSKWAFEMYANILLRPVMKLNVLRLANVYGPRQDPDGEAGVIAIFSKRMLEGRQVIIYGDGEQTRDFIYASDVSQACEMVQHIQESITVNIGSGIATSVNKIATIISKQADYSLSPSHLDKREGEVNNIVLDNSKANLLLGWTPSTSLEEGLSKTVSWFRAQRRSPLHKV